MDCSVGSLSLILRTGLEIRQCTQIRTFFALTTVVTNSCWSLSVFFRFLVIVGLVRETYLASRMRNADRKTRVPSA